jgi:hypothetical protein
VTQAVVATAQVAENGGVGGVGVDEAPEPMRSPVARRLSNPLRQREASPRPDLKAPRAPSAIAQVHGIRKAPAPPKRTRAETGLARTRVVEESLAKGKRDRARRDFSAISVHGEHPALP